MSKLHLFAVLVPLALGSACSSGKNARSCTSTIANGVQTVTCPDGTSASTANGANGASGAAGQTTLISVVTEPAGKNCANGGDAIETGVDTNGNGILDPGEATATSYVCSNVAAPPTTIVGDFVIENSVSLAQLSGITTITGRLSWASSFTAISLPALTEVGSLSIDTDASPLLTSVSLPALTKVDRLLRLNEDVKTAITLDLGAVITLGGLEIHATPRTDFTWLPKLAKVTGDFTLSQTPTITSLSPIAPALASITGSLDIEFSALTDLSAFSGVKSLKGVHLVGNKSVTTADFTALTTVTGDFYFEDMTVCTTLKTPALTHVGTLTANYNVALTQLFFPALTQIDGQFEVGGENGDALTTISAPVLVKTGSLDIDAEPVLTSIALPLLATSGDFYVADNAALATLTVTALTTAGYLQVSGNAVTALDLLALTTATDVQLDSDGFETIDLSSLAQVSQELEVENDASLTTLTLPVLAQVGSLVVNQDPALKGLALPVLAQAGNMDIDTNAAQTTLTLPLLATVGDIRIENAPITTLSFDALTTITGDANIDSLAITSAAFPLLTTTKDFNLDGNTALTQLTAPKWTTTTTAFVTSNSALPQCSVDAIFMHVMISDPGDSTTTGNDTDPTTNVCS